MTGKCSKPSYRRNQSKLQLLHNPSQIKRRNLDNARRENNKHFKNKKKWRKYPKGIIKELKTNSENRNINTYYTCAVA
jgi:ribosomal protein L16/L10AE